MREIKFRAWNKVEQKFEYDIINLYTIKDDYWNNNTSDTIFLQYTGLKDKNGVEICDGDILKTDCGNISVVNFNYEQLAIIEQQNKEFDDDMVWFVVGNIYQNKDLL